MGRIPVEPGSGLGCVGALIEQQDLGEVVAQAGPGLIVRAGDRSRRAGCDSGRLRKFGNGRVRSVTDDLAATGRLVFQGAPEEVGQVRGMHGRPVLLPAAEHDQVAGVVAGRAEKEPGNRAAAVPVGDT